MNDDNIFWFGGKNCYMDISGEYVPSSGWRYTTRLGDHLTCELNIYGRFSKRRDREHPRHFTAQLLYGSKRHTFLEGRCKSIRQAQKLTEEALRDQAHIREVGALAFQSQGACRVYRLKGRKYSEFCSILPAFSGYLFTYLGMPHGTYMKVHQDGCVISDNYGSWESSAGASRDEMKALIGSLAWGEGYEPPEQRQFSLKGLGK